jgi:hypothetical protein
MPDFKGEDFHLILAFVVPGVIALAVRSMFITGRNPKPTENLLTFLVLSLVYYSFIVFPQVTHNSGQARHDVSPFVVARTILRRCAVSCFLRWSHRFVYLRFTPNLANTNLFDLRNTDHDHKSVPT